MSPLAVTTLLGVPTADGGALLVGIGALLLLADALLAGPGISGITWGGTLPWPKRRLSDAAEVVGSLLVATGSVLLLIASRTLNGLSVLIVVAVAAAAIYVVMTLRLYAHMRMLTESEDSDERPRTIAWCFIHPLWKPTE